MAALVLAEKKTRGEPSLKKVLRPLIQKHSSLSGFHIMTTGSESFAMRLGMVQAAREAIDLQYYSIDNDTTANLLLEALLLAAERGVRVRFLIDNITLSKVKNTFSLLDANENIQIKVFNPFVTRADSLAKRITLLFTDLSRMNRRMHNKAMVSDKTLAIIGGRNLGDEYFEEHTDRMFRDIDILTAGKVTAEIAESFEDYWNHRLAVDIVDLHPRGIAGNKKDALRHKLKAHWQKMQEEEKNQELLSVDLANKLERNAVPFIWAEAEMVADPPEKMDAEPEAARSKPLDCLKKLLQSATQEFIAVSPYFVPKKEGVNKIVELQERGVKVKILTNSLASTDVVAVHTGYAPHRLALLEAGVELFELEAVGGKRPRQRLIGKSAPAHAGLHAKVYVVDRKEVIVGSFNLDPRGVSLNTEMAVVIHSQALAKQILEAFDKVTTPDTSYRLTLEQKGRKPRITWHAQEKGRDVQFSHEPRAGLWRRVEAYFIGKLPIENNL